MAWKALQTSFIISAVRIEVAMNSPGSAPNSSRSTSLVRCELAPTIVNGG